MNSHFAGKLTKQFNMKPWKQQHFIPAPNSSNIGGISSPTSRLDHWFLPMTAQRLHQDPVQQPYYTNHLFYHESAGTISTVLKPVAVRLTNVYAGLPISFSLLGACGAWEADSISRSMGKQAESLGFIPPVQDHQQETANSLLTDLLSSPTSLHNHSALSYDLKEHLNLRLHLLQNRHLYLNAQGAPLCNESISTLPTESTTSSYSKPNIPTSKAKCHFGYNSDKVAVMPKPYSVSETLHLKTANIEKSSKILSLKKSRKHFLLPSSKNSNMKVEIVKEKQKTMFDEVKEQSIYKSAQIDSSKIIPLSKNNFKVNKMSTNGKKKNDQSLVNMLIKEYQLSSDITSKTISKDNAHKKLENVQLKDTPRPYQTSPGMKKTFHCPHCRYTTDRKNNLKRHVVTMHQETSKTLECCGIVFESKASLRDHNAVFHKGGYRCQICSRNFCRKALLRRHLTVHSGQKDFFCTLCGYATSHKSNLERHQKVHYKKDSLKIKKIVSFRKKRLDENKPVSYKKSSKLTFNPNMSLGSQSTTIVSLGSQSKTIVSLGSQSKTSVSLGSHSKTSVSLGSQSKTSVSTKSMLELHSKIRVPRVSTKEPAKTMKNIKDKGLCSYLNASQDTPLCLAGENPHASAQQEKIRHNDVAAESETFISKTASPPLSQCTQTISSHTVQDANVCKTKSVSIGICKSRSMLENEEDLFFVAQVAMTSPDLRKRLFSMKYECSLCGKCFKLQSSLCLHEQQCHSSQETI